MTPERWRQLEELYDALKDLPPAERGVRLKDAGPELRSAVEAIFAQEGSALEHPAWQDWFESSLATSHADGRRTTGAIQNRTADR